MVINPSLPPSKIFVCGLSLTQSQSDFEGFSSKSTSQQGVKTPYASYMIQIDRNLDNCNGLSFKNVVKKNKHEVIIRHLEILGVTLPQNKTVRLFSINFISLT